MNFLLNVLEKTEGFKAIKKALKPKSKICATGLTEIHKATIIHSLCHLKNVRAFCVAPDEQKAQTLCNDLCTMGTKAVFYPTRDFVFKEISGKSREYEHQRLNVLYKMLTGDYDVVVACIDGATQYTMPKDVLKNAVLDIKVGATISTDFCIKALTLLGYQRFDQVDGKGQFSLRGGILDFFMPDSDYPIRAEFWGDEITDLNYFDVETQRRTDKVEQVKQTKTKKKNRIVKVEAKKNK